MAMQDKINWKASKMIRMICLEILKTKKPGNLRFRAKEKINYFSNIILISLEKLPNRNCAMYKPELTLSPLSFVPSQRTE